ncbi:MAG: carbamate kinase [Ignavibacteriales bacterium]|nr:MAG: carbamate kinase [Ignavibacteriales bacterium]
MKKLVVVAFGGNALLRAGQSGTAEEQEQNSYDTCKNLIPLIKEGNDLIITHGNGPQVGNIYLRSDAGYSLYNLPKMPLDIAVADSQGEIGYMIERQMRNLLIENGIDKKVITILTQVLVDKNDESFKEPSKPVGPYYLKEEAELMSKANNWLFKEDARKRGWRRVVASPKPIDIVNNEIIGSLAKAGNIVIASGGGGIPVYLDEKNTYRPIEDAVIDKDLATALLASQIGADNFYILTDVSKVCINFNKPNQKDLDLLKIDEAKLYYNEGQFPAGSMGPKILAAIDFVERSGKETIITEATQLLNNGCGTRIVL